MSVIQRILWLCILLRQQMSEVGFFFQQYQVDHAWYIAEYNPEWRGGKKVVWIKINKDTINLIKDSTSTALNIAQMTQYRVKYLQDRDAEAKEKMYKHAFLAGVGILSLLTMGVLGLMESRRSNNRVMDCLWWVWLISQCLDSRVNPQAPGYSISWCEASARPLDACYRRDARITRTDERSKCRAMLASAMPCKEEVEHSSIPLRPAS